jgi:hypothetical protein
MREDLHPLGAVPVWPVAVDDVGHYAERNKSIVRSPRVSDEEKKKEQKKNEKSQFVFVGHCELSLCDFTTDSTSKTF